MASEDLRIGIIGAGVGVNHIKGYAKTQGARVVAVCDINEERAREIAHANGLKDAKIFADHRAMLDSVDAVSVAVPNKFHLPISLDCLQAGKHVLCEKPLAMSAQEGQQIADAAAQNGVKCMVGQVNRFRADSQFLKKALQDGEAGQIYYAHTGWLRKRGIPGYGGWFTTKEMSGGGPLIDIGVHMLDIAWWLCGCPNPVSVTGITYDKFGPRGKGLGTWGTHVMDGTFNVEDLAVAMIRFDNGLTINLEVSWAINCERDRQWCHLYGDEGGADWGEHPGIYRDLNEVPLVAHPNLSKGDSWQGQCQHFTDAILNDTTPDPDANQGVTMMKMLDAIYESAKNKREVVLNG